MSFQAMTWAADQRAGGPSAKATLWAIANFANHDGVAWPSQKLIAEQSDQSVDSVQKRIADLDGRGLVRRVPLKFGGRKTVDFIILAISPFFRSSLAEIEPLLPRGCVVDPRTSDVAADCGSDKKATTDGVGAESLVESKAAETDDAAANCGSDQNATLPQPAAHATALVRQQEPVMEPREPSVEREARARAEDPQPENDAQFQRLLKRYPGVHSPGLAFPAWRRLDDEGRRRSLARLDAYLAERRKLKNDTVFALQNYLRERIFDQVDEPADGKPTPTTVKPRTDEWWALFWRRRKAGERVVVMLDQAKGDGSWGCDIQALPGQAEIDALVEIETGSEQFRAWSSQLASEGLRLGGQACGKYIRVPSEWPQEDVKTARTG